MRILKNHKWKLTAGTLLLAVCFSSYGLVSTSYGALCSNPCKVPEFYDNGQWTGDCVDKCPDTKGDCGVLDSCSGGCQYKAGTCSSGVCIP